VARNEANYHSIAIQAMTQTQGGIAASIGNTTYILSGPDSEFVRNLLSQPTQSGSRWGHVLLKSQQWAFAQENGKRGYYTDLMWTECLLGDPALRMFNAAGPDDGLPGNNGGAPSFVQPQEPLKINHLFAFLNFNAARKDSIRIDGEFNETNILGGRVEIVIGPRAFDFQINTRGYGQSIDGRIKIRTTKSGASKFTAIIRADFSPSLNQASLSPLPIEVLLITRAFGAMVPAKYHAVTKHTGILRNALK
jgi:hypothetical protein